MGYVAFLPRPVVVPFGGFGGANSASGGVSPPPDGGGDDEGDKARFGKDANQESHAFRHVDKAGLDRRAVRGAIKEDLSKVGNSLKNGPYNGRVNVNGTQVDLNRPGNRGGRLV